MPRSPWSVAGEALVTVVVLVCPAALASWLGWPLEEHTDWTWLWQYLRGGNIPSEAMIAALVVILWAIWAAHLVIVVLDVIALLRGLVPRVGLVRLVWVLAAGGATATSTHTAAVAAQTDLVTQAPAQPELAQDTDTPPEQDEGQDCGMIDRVRNLSYFGFDSAVLTPEMQQSLAPTVDLISDFTPPGASVTVTGHTDPVGDPAYNQLLSERRAQAVADYLAQQLGTDVELEVRGAGSTQPPPSPQKPHGEYRRVEIAYTLQPPAATDEPEPSAQTEAEEPGGAAAEPERVHLDVTPTSGQGSGSDPLLVGAVAGTVGLGVGYAAGRRRTSGTRARIRPFVPEPKADDAPSQASQEEIQPASGNLLRDDAGGLANGVIDEDGYVLVADTVRVDGREGLTFTGTHATGALRAVITDHLPDPVIATRTLLAALDEPDATFRGVQEIADLRSAWVAVESASLTAARHGAEADESGSAREALASHALVVCEASDLDSAPDLGAALTAVPGAVVCVLGEHVDQASGGASLRCEDLNRVQAVTAYAEATRNDTRLRYRDPAKDLPEDREEAVDQEDLPEEREPVDSTPHAPRRSEGDRPRVRLRLFSEQLAVEVEGKRVQGLRTVGRTLLTYLALHPNGVSAEEIVQTCFATMDSLRAASARKNAIASIRSRLRTVLEGPEHLFIVHRNGRYALDPDLFSVDLWSFSVSYKEAQETSGDRRREILYELVDAHSEKLLSGMGEAWIESTRKACVRVMVEALLAIADDTSDEGDKVALLERACLFDEFNEPIYQRIMEIHVSRGRPEIAHQVYRTLKDKLSLLKEKPNSTSRAIIESATKPV